MVHAAANWIEAHAYIHSSIHPSIHHMDSTRCQAVAVHNMDDTHGGSGSSLPVAAIAMDLVLRISRLTGSTTCLDHDPGFSPGYPVPQGCQDRINNAGKLQHEKNGLDRQSFFRSDWKSRKN
jgi:hypothetical protein